VKSLLFIAAVWQRVGTRLKGGPAADDERRLIERIKQGDDDAFVSLVDRYKKKAFGIAYRFTDSAEDAEDLSQEAFLRAYRSIGSFKGGARFYTWFYRILINLCIDHARKRRTAPDADSVSRVRSGTRDMEVEYLEDRHTHTSPEKAVFTMELRERVTEAIASLPDRQKQVFILRHYEGFSLKEIAETIQCAEGTVKAHLSRAVRRLQISRKYRPVCLR